LTVPGFIKWIAFIAVHQPVARLLSKRRVFFAQTRGRYTCRSHSDDPAGWLGQGVVIQIEKIKTQAKRTEFR
jgi:hypothetical protein